MKGPSRPLATIALLAAGCAGAPAPGPTAVPAVGSGARGPVVPVAASPRILLDGSTTAPSTVGPRIPQGTLVVLSGRRALVTAAGAVRDETVSLPGLLFGLVEAVDRNGAPRVVGWRPRGIVLLDPADPLGKAQATVLLAEGESLLGSMPGVAVVRRGRSAIADVDLDTGVARPPLPELPLRSIAFRSAAEGAAVFAGAGLVVSTDGGRSFRRVAGDTGAVASVALRGSALVAVSGAEEAVIDVARASIGLFHPPGSPGEPLTVRWVRRTGTDPLVEAVTHGTLLPGTSALIAAPGLLARIDAATGAVQELVETGPPPTAPGYGCEVDRAGADLWASCNTGNRWSRFRIHADEPLRADPIVAEIAGIRERVRLSTGVGGGALWTAPCAAEDRGAWCVRQPDGRWRSVHVPPAWADSAGPLADGRVAYLRAPEPEIEAVGVDGTTAKIATLPQEGECHAEPKAMTPIEEDETGLLHLMTESPCGPLAIAQRPGAPAEKMATVPAMAVRLRHGHGWAASGDQLWWSTSFGLRWEILNVPQELFRRGHWPDSLKGPAGEALVAGWLPFTADPPAAPFVRMGVLPRIEPAPHLPRRRLECSSTSAAPLPIPPSDGRLDRDGAILVRDGPLRWIDGTEIGGQEHAFRGSLPPSLAGLTLTTGRARGGRGAFLFTSGGARAALAYVDGRGAIQVAALDRGSLPFAGDVAFGARDGDLLGWTSSGPDDHPEEVTRVLAMRPGSPPEVVAAVLHGGERRDQAWPYPSTLLVGASHDALLLIATGNRQGDGAAARVLKKLSAGARAAEPTLDGWLSVAPLDPTTLLPCADGHDDAAFALRMKATDRWATPHVGGIRADVTTAIYDLRIWPPDPASPLPPNGERPLLACVAGVTAILEESPPRMDDDMRPRSPPPPGATPGPRIVRYDARKRTGEGGPPGATQRMRCALDEPPAPEHD